MLHITLILLTRKDGHSNLSFLSWTQVSGRLLRNKKILQLCSNSFPGPKCADASTL